MRASVFFAAVIWLFNLVQPSAAETAPAAPGFEGFTVQLIELGLLQQKDALTGSKVNTAAEKFRLKIASPARGQITEAEKSLLANPDNVRAQIDTLKVWLHEYSNQRKLVASGALNAAVGSALLDELRQAISEFRSATVSLTIGSLSEKERSDLDAAEVAINRFAQFKEITVSRNQQPFWLPSGVVRTELDEDGDRSWITFSSADEKFKVDFIRIPLHSLTPVQLARMVIEKRKQLEFERLDLTGEGFEIEALATRRVGGTREYVSFGVHEHNGFVQGYGFRVDLDKPGTVAIPHILVQRQGKDAAIREMAAKLDVDTNNWRPVVKVIRNLLASELAKLESLEPISRASCRGVRTAADGVSKIVKILYATDREEDLSEAFSNPVQLDRLYSTELDSTLHIGCLEVEVVRVPLHTRSNLLEAGYSKMLGRISPTHSVVAKKAEKLLTVDFTKSKRLVLRGDEVSGGEKALLFIHGYNNGFKDAVERVARIAAASDYNGLIYLFSWPSRQWAFNYASDMDFAEQAEVHLTGFLKAVMASGDIASLDIVAHSMGSQILLRTLDSLRPQLDRRLSTDPYDNVRFGQIIFAAPDVSSIVFAQKVVPFKYFAKQITVYASANDGVLDWSGWLRDGVPRAGFIEGKEPVNVEGVNVIDVTQSEVPRYLHAKRILGSYHGAFADDNAVLNDIADILRFDYGKVQYGPPSLRAEKAKDPSRFVEQEFPDGTKRKYWSLAPPAAPATKSLAGVP